MTYTEAVFIWIAVWFYGMSFLSFLYGFAFKNEGAGRWGWYIAAAGFVPQTVSMGVRWGVTGHPPVMREYEIALLGSWLILIVFGFMRRRHRRLEIIGVAIMPIMLMMIGKGLLMKPYLEPLAPQFKSNWLWLHILFGWAAYGAFCVASGLGIIYLLKERAEKRGKALDFYGRLPALGIINDLMLRNVIFGFIGLTVEVGAGAIWAHQLWGRYWGWDPIETWSLITWLVYGAYIHLGISLGWKGRRMAWLAIISIISLFITYGGIGYVSGIHTPV